MKKCCHCQILKLVEFFSSNKSRPDGYRDICKECDKIFRRKMYDKNKEREWAAKKIYYGKNKDKINRQRRIYLKENPQKMKLWAKAQYDKDKCNPKWRVDHSMSGHIRKSLLGQKRRRKWESLVGYTLQNLVIHLEKQFCPGMTWENYGLHGWHIDHIIPKSSFHYTTAEDEQFKKCWALNNLQPLWAIDNYRKHNKL